MKIVCISDIHGFYEGIRVPDGDVLVVAGDFLGQGRYVSEVVHFNDWLGTLPHKHKIVVAGNHELVFEAEPSSCIAALTNAHYLEDSGLTIDGVKFWGSPWQPEFCDWAFNLPRQGEALDHAWSLIPVDIDVLITHGPPWGVLDRVKDSAPLGCELLAARVLQVRPKVHIFGHIHYSAGEAFKDGVHFVNAAICNERYRSINKPIVVDLDYLEDTL